MRDIVIVAGTSGSGKTFAWARMEGILTDNDFKVNFISDGEILAGIVQEREEGVHFVHPHPGKPAFCIIHPEPGDETVRRWIKRIPSPQKGKVNVIEVSRGVGKAYPEVDLSFGRLRDLVPGKIWERAIVLLVESPLKLRMEWNVHRRENPREELGKESFYCPTMAMENIFRGSDAGKNLLPWLKEQGVPSYSIENNKTGAEGFQKKVEATVSDILSQHLSAEGAIKTGSEPDKDFLVGKNV